MHVLYGATVGSERSAGKPLLRSGGADRKRSLVFAYEQATWRCENTISRNAFTIDPTSVARAQSIRVVSGIHHSGSIIDAKLLAIRGSFDRMRRGDRSSGRMSSIVLGVTTCFAIDDRTQTSPKFIDLSAYWQSEGNHISRLVVGWPLLADGALRMVWFGRAGVPNLRASTTLRR